MTERPRTMMLQPFEWRSLVATGANNIYSYISAMDGGLPPNPTQMTWLHDTIDRLKMQVSAWAASGQPIAQVMSQQTALAEGHDITAPFTNGTGSVVPAGPKKKRGWQKGRKRGPRKPKGSEAVQ